MSIMIDGTPEARYSKQVLGRDDLSNQFRSFQASEQITPGDEAVQRADVAETKVVENLRELDAETEKAYQERIKSRYSSIALAEAGIVKPVEYWDDAPQLPPASIDKYSNR